MNITEKDSKIYFKITSEDLSTISECIIMAERMIQDYISTYSEENRLDIYGHNLRIKVIDLLTDKFNQSIKGSRRSTKIILNNGFSFYVTATQDFFRTATYKTEQPELFNVVIDNSLVSGKFDCELVLCYDNCHLISAELQSHNPAFSPITVYDDSMRYIKRTEKPQKAIMNNSFSSKDQNNKKDTLNA